MAVSREYAFPSVAKSANEGTVESSWQSAFYSAFDEDPHPITEYLQWLAASYALKPPLRVLDVGCGPGRMLPEFAALGWPVVGIDPDPDFCVHAAMVAAPLPHAEVFQLGFNDIEAIREFDLVVAVNGAFSYLLTVRERIDALRRSYRALRPGGVLFLDMANFSWILRHYRDPDEELTTFHGRRLTRKPHHTLDYHHGVLDQVDEYVFDHPECGTIRLQQVHRFALIGLPEILYFMDEQGFEEIRTYNGYRSRDEEYLTGDRIMISARKPFDPD